MLFWTTVAIFAATAYGLGRGLTKCEHTERAYDAGYADALAYCRGELDELRAELSWMQHPANGGPERES